MPDLRRGLELGSLLNAPKTDNDHSWILRLRSVQRRTALRAEYLSSTVPALSDLDIRLDGAAERERFNGRRNHGSERCAGQDLAVGAVTNLHARWINESGERDGATVAGTIDLHFRSCDAGGVCDA